MNELVGMLHAEDRIPEELRMLSLRALAVQLLDRNRHVSSPPYIPTEHCFSVIEHHIAWCITLSLSPSLTISSCAVLFSLLSLAP